MAIFAVLIIAFIIIRSINAKRTSQTTELELGNDPTVEDIIGFFNTSTLFKCETERFEIICIGGIHVTTGRSICTCLNIGYISESSGTFWRALPFDDSQGIDMFTKNRLEVIQAIDMKKLCEKFGSNTTVAPSDAFDDGIEIRRTYSIPDGVSMKHYLNYLSSHLSMETFTSGKTYMSVDI